VHISYSKIFSSLKKRVRKGMAEAQPEIIAGGSLSGTTINQIAQNSSGIRCCAIEIRNFHNNFELSEPNYYLERGWNSIPPVPVIRPRHREACLFRQQKAAFYGSSGILTYKINHVVVDKKTKEVISREYSGSDLVLMWSVPFNYNNLVNTHAVGVMERAEPSRELFYLMYEDKVTEIGFKRAKAGVCVNYKAVLGNTAIKILATMSEVGKATWVIELQ